MSADTPSFVDAPLTPETLTRRLRQLYAHAESSPTFFASPLGPIQTGAGLVGLPRFVSVGSRESTISLRVAIYAGFDRYDLRSTEVVLHVIERLIASPHLSDGTSLSFFPWVDALGTERVEQSDLEGESWAAPTSDEIALLARDVRSQAYDVLVRVDHSSDASGLVRLRVTGHLPSDLSLSADEVLLSSDLEPLEVRFERDSATPRVGPLTLTDDLGRPPVELYLSFPPDLDGPQAGSMAFVCLSRLLARYQAHQATAQHI